MSRDSSLEKGFTQRFGVSVPPSITLNVPPTVTFGAGCVNELVDELSTHCVRRLFVAVTGPIFPAVKPILEHIKSCGMALEIWQPGDGEPTIEDYEQAVGAARRIEADAVVGIGGGSVLDLAKLVAAQMKSPSDVRSVMGIDRLERREVYLSCIPTTSGTGSEVSPNAILLDETLGLKRGVVSRHLVPDSAFIDPALTISLPPDLTASTAIDALTHCIEAYVNRYAHPICDLFALEGIRLISRSLRRAYTHGDDLNARSDLLLASMYGGLCLGPVNTGAVHALAYPLGGMFHIPHGVSNAVLLPHVMKFNLPAAAGRYADVAVALGVEPFEDPETTAAAGIDHLISLSRSCQMPQSLADLGLPDTAIGTMAEAAMKVTRLLDRNVRRLTQHDAEAIYQEAFVCSTASFQGT